MASINVRQTPKLYTHEGARAYVLNDEKKLRRAVMACLLWEDQFYEDGTEIAERIAGLVSKVRAEQVEEIAIEAREVMKLRHVPLLLVAELAHRRHNVEAVLTRVIQRPDELGEFLAIYWKDKKQTLSASVKRGLRAAFGKFNEYQLAKYSSRGTIKLRDVMFLVHPNPAENTNFKGNAAKYVYKKLAEDTLVAFDTWEDRLSAGEDKRRVFEELIAENKLGALALLRNLRGMTEAGVPERTVRQAIVNMKTERVLPFRFITAQRHAPQFGRELEHSMFKCLEGTPTLPGRTILLVDRSGSMSALISGKSALSQYDAACGLAMLLREVCEQVRVVLFNNTADLVNPTLRGFGLRQAMGSPNGGTMTENAKQIADRAGYDRLIIITDEQSHQNLSAPKANGYVINVASAKNGVGYGKWLHIDGWSETVVDYIRAFEAP